MPCSDVAGCFGFEDRHKLSQSEDTEYKHLHTTHRVPSKRNVHITCCARDQRDLDSILPSQRIQRSSLMVPFSELHSGLGWVR